MLFFTYLCGVIYRFTEMYWNELWDFVKRNIFAIVLIVTLVVAVPWSLIFVLPIAIFLMALLAVVWRIRRAQKQMFDEARRQAGEQRYDQQSQQRSWWNKNRREGEVTVIHTEPTEQRVNDNVGEDVEFKEIKNK